ncbi:hypothetical protein F5984_03425 [Rudanella paleaurantiibacter]|uniref:Uncharacterized protein n=1 Tax=Rudanella paleaurantiibacter TaxID=2614655 RepID=A0A7J5U607_9BACT|nr:hypothetical protein [Rudanella paleaurantiibacter]KAB7733007.1 hypothetical protein F5984_03425 [Rudanella paleaurantiibacter]
MQTRYLQIGFCLLVGFSVRAQVPNDRVSRRGSVPAHSQIPTRTPKNEFYRRPGDTSNVVRATLDNMPVRGYDKSAAPMPVYDAGSYLKEELVVPRRKKKK